MPSHTPDHCHGKHCTPGCRHPRSMHVPNPGCPQERAPLLSFPIFQRKLHPLCFGQAVSVQGGREEAGWGG